MRTAKGLLVLLGIWVVLMFALPFTLRLYWLATDKDYYGWPAVTVCRLCNKTVWTWQAYDRRPIPLDIENKDGLAMSCSMTGLMHTSCKGTPKPSKVTVTLD